MRYLILIISTLALSCGKSAAEQYCDCVVDNDCWASDSCPADPRGSCYWVEAKGPLPAYANGDESNVCYGVNLDCSVPKCGEAPPH